MKWKHHSSPRESHSKPKMKRLNPCFLYKSNFLNFLYNKMNFYLFVRQSKLRRLVMHPSVLGKWNGTPHKESTQLQNCLMSPNITESQNQRDSRNDISQPFILKIKAWGSDRGHDTHDFTGVLRTWVKTKVMCVDSHRCVLPMTGAFPCTERGHASCTEWLLTQRVLNGPKEQSLGRQLYSHLVK